MQTTTIFFHKSQEQLKQKHTILLNIEGTKINQLKSVRKREGKAENCTLKI